MGKGTVTASGNYALRAQEDKTYIINAVFKDAEIASEIFAMTAEGEYQLTLENVDARLEAQRAMIEGYDYAALFAQEEEEE